MVENPNLRAVCIREVQNSLAESSKAVIEGKIKAHGVEDYFRVTNNTIESTRGSGVILFRGMQNHTSSSIPSLEGIDRAWCDEAQHLGEMSLRTLIPTIRKQGSEIWFSWNPLDPKDPVDKFFRVEGVDDEDFACVQANYADNPWVTRELIKDMLRDRRVDTDRYLHVWLGKYSSRSTALVFKNWRIEEFETPADARFYFGADWGFSIDPTVLVRCFAVGRKLYVDREVYKVGCEIDHTPALFAGTDTYRGEGYPQRWANPYGWRGIPGAIRWPIRADSSNPQSISYMRNRGFMNISPAVKGPGSVEEGIEFLRSYEIIVHPSCVNVISELGEYSYKVDARTLEVLPVLEDRKNHTIDSLRYAVELLRRGPARAVAGRATGSRVMA